MKITLLRHGTTTGNIDRLYYGKSDILLAEEGKAELTELKKRYSYPFAEAYFTSGMLRAEQSFKILYGDIDHGILPGLKEMDFGVFEMRNYEELKQDPLFIEWISGDTEDTPCPGGESGTEVTARAQAALDELAAMGKDAVVITHGGVIGGIMALYFPSSIGRFAYSAEPGTGYTIEFEDGVPVSWSAAPKEIR